jgi:hypothetical protein
MENGHRGTQDAVRLAEQRWGIHLKYEGRGEWHGPCPLTPGCATEDGFMTWETGTYFCRKCGKSGWVNEESFAKFTAEEREAWERERLARREEERALQEQRQSTALAIMAECRDWERYHALLSEVPPAREYWEQEGLSPEWIDFFSVGWCSRCPSDRLARPSYTMPNIDETGTLVDIQHRLQGATNGDRYRPHITGLGRLLFNARVLKESEWVIIGEGAKKCMVAESWGFYAAGIPGKKGWDPLWLPRFANQSLVYVALDPDALGESWAIARQFGGRARVVNLTVKLDDFFAKHNGTQQELRAFLRDSVPVGPPRKTGGLQ